MHTMNIDDPSHMDFFYHFPSITAEVSVAFSDGHDSDTVFFDRVNVGSDDLKGISSRPFSDLAVNITPEQIHPAFPPTGLAFWVEPPERKVRRETPTELPAYGLTPLCSMGAPCASLPHHCQIPSSHHS